MVEWATSEFIYSWTYLSNKFSFWALAVFDLFFLPFCSLLLIADLVVCLFFN